MIQIADQQSLVTLMQYRYEPVLLQVLQTVCTCGPVLIKDANPCDTCKPIREIHLSAAAYQDTEMDRMMDRVNTAWAFGNQWDEKAVIEYQSDFTGERVIVRVGDETRRQT